MSSSSCYVFRAKHVLRRLPCQVHVGLVRLQVLTRFFRSFVLFELQLDLRHIASLAQNI